LFIVEFRWCRDVKELLIQIGIYSTIHGESQAAGDSLRHVFDEIMGDLLPLLGWTKMLKSLVILRSNSQRDENLDDENLTRCFFNWLMLKNEWGNLPPLNDGLISLERFWIDDKRFTAQMSPQMEENCLTAHAVKSVVLPEERFWDPHVLDNERFEHLEHLADVYFSRLDHLANLKYIRGTVVDFLVYNQSSSNSYFIKHLYVIQLTIISGT